MKKLVILALLIAHSATSFSQTNETTEVDSAPNTTAPKAEKVKDNPPAPKAAEQKVKEQAAVIDGKIEWYLPEIKVSKNKKRKILRLRGFAGQNALVQIPKRKIPIIVGRGKVLFYSTKKAFVGGNKTHKKIKYATLTDESGNFYLDLKLPIKPTQLPIRIRRKGLPSKNVVLNIDMRKDAYDVINKKLLSAHLIKDYKYGLWAGLGMNYLDYTQSSQLTPSSSLELTYASFKLPALYLKGEYRLNNKWDFSLEYKNTPGEVPPDADDVISISGSKEYAWNIIDLGAYYTPTKWTRLKLPFGLTGDVSARFGYQSHTIPFLKRTAASTVKVDTSSMGILTAGALLRAYNLSSWVYEVFMRYQLPLIGDGQFDIASQFSFDGSVGAYYNYNKKLRLGVYWYGQYLNYDFSNFTEEFGSNVISGTQALLYSNIEFRVGYQF